MIKIIAVGKVDKRIDSLINEYSKRLRNFEIIEVKEDKILDNIKDSDYVIACDEKGKVFSSVEFSDMLYKIEKKNTVFVIGPAHGLSDAVRQKADLLLSFSKMTFPHEMFRLFLVEQIYRAYAIKKGINYHKD